MTTQSNAPLLAAAAWLCLVSGFAPDLTQSARGQSENATSDSGQPRAQGHATSGDQWRKTTRGWEWLELARQGSDRVQLLQVHPVLLAASQALTAIGIWLVGESSRRTARHPQTAILNRPPVSDRLAPQIRA